ncbi:pantoate--beta-alanine ligase [Ruegeria sp. 2012CJ41-6]|uniref:Pantothenate synthetase n=1 Tax=Ruegeria spongiae TaxID=2942209 RepID=A0ABT0PYY9_9RHOB|nr:pantoate--beta-alanine ligase [Ruegeria spongiae]MCL6282392.1 pantoate--beta-alanine ligase [Ruegeria spongiae]
MTRILRRLNDLRAQTAQWRSDGQSVGVVPTMGALHEGHLSLVEAAKAQCDRIVVTIFVNPMQFNNPGDLTSYPRVEAEDAGKLSPLGVDLIYAPAPEEVYPSGFATTISVDGLTEMMEGPNRPGHFDGVATVVAKLFLKTQADRAYFGEKDYQQLLVVRRMADDLNIPIEVVGCDTVREASGLAMSSRNRRLSEAGMRQAAALHQVMREVAQALSEGAEFAPLQAEAVGRLEQAGFDPVEYLELRDVAALAPLEAASANARLFAAAFIEGVRLIDNIAVPAR